MSYPATGTMDPDDTALASAFHLRAGLLAWQASDPELPRTSLAKAFRDNWDKRIGKAMFGGVWSISMARTNLQHPASRAALAIPRREWTGASVTVEHAVPIRILFERFLEAEEASRMRRVLETYRVAVVTREEDARLRAAGLTSSMPSGWRWGDCPNARWEAVGIVVEGL